MYKEDQCKTCPPGNYCPVGTPLTATLPLPSCHGGTYCPVGAEAPTDCEEGTYQPGKQQDFCFDCPHGSYCAVGSASATESASSSARA